MLRALEICTSSSHSTNKDAHNDLEEYLPPAPSNASTPSGSLHGGIQGQKHHIIPARGRFLANEDRREPSVGGSAYRDSLMDASICSPQPEVNGGAFSDRRPPASCTDIKGILPSNGIKSVGNSSIQLALIVEDAVWPEYTLCDSRSWALHKPCLEPETSGPGIQVHITKTEVRGPKTSPYVVYIMHIRTAFSVRGLARRFSEFRHLDSQLRLSFSSLPPLPGRRVFGSLSAQLVAERRRHLQEYIDGLLSDEDIACSEPLFTFLQVHGHATEENILFRSSNDIGRRIWDMPIGAPTEGVEQLLDTLRCRGDKRQEGRTQNCLGLMYAERGSQEKAIPILQDAIETCKVGLKSSQNVEAKNGDEESLADVEFWSTGLITCISNLGCVLTKTGQLQGALERFREGVAVGGELGDIGGQANCLGKISMVLASKGDIHGAIKVGAGAVEMWEAAGENERMASMSLVLGAMHLSKGQVRQAVEHLESSLLLSRKARDKMGLSEGMHALGTCFAHIGYHAHALEHLQQALSLSREIGDRIGEARCLCVLGYVLLSQNDYQRCLEHYDASLRLFELQGDLFGQVGCHEGMAKARRAMGEGWLADAHVEEAASIRSSPAAMKLSPHGFSRDVVDSPRRTGFNVGQNRSTQVFHRQGMHSHVMDPDHCPGDRVGQGYEQEELLGGHSRTRSRRMAGDQDPIADGHESADASLRVETFHPSSTPSEERNVDSDAFHDLTMRLGLIKSPDLVAGCLDSKPSALGSSINSRVSSRIKDPGMTISEQVMACEFMANDEPAENP